MVKCPRCAVVLPSLSPVTVAGAASVFHRLPCCPVQGMLLSPSLAPTVRVVMTQQDRVSIALGSDHICRQGSTMMVHGGPLFFRIAAPSDWRSPLLCEEIPRRGAKSSRSSAIVCLEGAVHEKTSLRLSRKWTRLVPNQHCTLPPPAGMGQRAGRPCPQSCLLEHLLLRSRLERSSTIVTKSDRALARAVWVRSSSPSTGRRSKR